MDNAVVSLCEALKKIFWKLKPVQNPLSFLVLIGLESQGKTTFLKQSQLEQVTLTPDSPWELFYNSQGVVIELHPSLLNQPKGVVNQVIKQLNRCHRNASITGVVLCIDVNHLNEPLPSINLLDRICQSIPYAVDIALILTKVDMIAGFGEFFHGTHEADLKKPLGFSLPAPHQKASLLNQFKTKFDQLIEVLGQQVIPKMHPARSSEKRTFIREFPLQLALLRSSLQSFIQLLSTRRGYLQAIYFTSAAQGGPSLDRLNKKIQQEYALSLFEALPQALNYRAYFIEEALDAIQQHTKGEDLQKSFQYKKPIFASISIAISITVGLLWHSFHTMYQLDAASKELIAYENQLTFNGDKTGALYHLTQANQVLNQISEKLSSPSLNNLKQTLNTNVKTNFAEHFIPWVLQQIEQRMTNPRQSQLERYEALKVYLMLGAPNYLNSQVVLNWFQSHDLLGSKETKMLLTSLLKNPFQALPINKQLVTDTRNYLNALPASYFYYVLLKKHFPETSIPLQINGFTLASREIPTYFTKKGFQSVIQMLPNFAYALQKENWVLARQDIGELRPLLEQAYCYDYVLWWQHFMEHSKPLHAQTYDQASQLLQNVSTSHAFSTLINLVQKETSLENGPYATLFNQEIASKFVKINLITQTLGQSLSTSFGELEKFVRTLSLVNDGGSTAFGLIKARFSGEIVADPLSLVYQQINQLPSPLNTWAVSIANDIWFVLINDSRDYLNQQWQRQVYQEYIKHIANHYPFDASEANDVSIKSFNHFFSKQGHLRHFMNAYLKPFIDMSKPQWQLKELNGYVLPISADMINELIRANVISTMFFPDDNPESHIQFTLQKISLDPVVSSLQLSIGQTSLRDDQNTETITQFTWPGTDAKLTLNSIEGNRYTLEEEGPWAFFKLLQKVNVLVDEHDSSILQILFEVNGNSGRYVLKAHNQINPFIPGILNGFSLSENIA